jgi:ankyrin repeat protein
MQPGEQYAPVLFNAAKDGNLARIQILLDHQSAQFLNDALNPKESTPPIVIAARHGHVDVVRYMIAKGANPGAVGTVAFDGETIQGAPALWAAAAGGHLPVVRLLVEEARVEINQPTSTNSTPLRGACYDGHLPIVQYLVGKGADIEIPNRHGHTALMIASYREKVDVVKYLLELGADVNRSSAKGNTALHDAAEAGNVAITRLLLSAGAVMQKDEYGVTPLYCAAMLAHTEVIQVLFPHASYVEKRDTWKLLGSTMMDKRMDMSSAITCWRNSFEYDALITLNSEDGEITPLSEVANKMYGGMTEILSSAELEDMSGDPEALRLQALVIRERILGDFHPEVHYYLRYRGAVFCDMGRWDRAFEMWAYLLQLQQHYFCPLHQNTMSTILAFMDTFSSLVDDLLVHPEHRNPNEIISVEQVVIVLERAIYELERYLHRDQESQHDLEYLLEETDPQKDIENLLPVLLNFIHLVSRVALLNQQMNCRNGNGAVAADVLQLANSQFDTANNSNAQQNGEAQAAADGEALRARVFSVHFTLCPKGEFMSRDMCKKATLTPLEERLPHTPKAVFQLHPTCRHLLCVIRRLVKIYEYMGTSPLAVACEEQNPAETKRSPSHFVISRLLDAGADVNRTDNKGNTALHILLSSTW